MANLQLEIQMTVELAPSMLIHAMILKYTYRSTYNDNNQHGDNKCPDGPGSFARGEPTAEEKIFQRIHEHMKAWMTVELATQIRS